MPQDEVVIKIRLDPKAIRLVCAEPGCGRFIAQGTVEELRDRIEAPSWKPEAAICPTHGEAGDLSIDPSACLFSFIQRSL